MILRFLDAPKCSGPSKVLTLWSEREPGLEKNKHRIWVLSIFRAEFLRSSIRILIQVYN